MKLLLNDSIEQIMNKLEHKLRQLPRPFLTDIELGAILGGTAASQYGKIKRLLAQGTLIHLRRGLYALNKDLGHIKDHHPFEIAQFIYGPSYISLESALSYHGLIPEAVYTTTSVCIKRSKNFNTPLGNFSFQSMPITEFYTQVAHINENGYQFLIAEPWKAICDYVYCYKKDWHNLSPLYDSLRIELENLPILKDNEAQALDDYYHHKRLHRFIKGIK